MLLPAGAPGRNDMFTAKISIRPRWIIQYEALRGSIVLADKLPGRSEVVLGSSHLEVIDVYDKEDLEGRMYEATSPIRDSLKPLLLQVTLAMSFPVTSAIGVTI
eukprot:3703429-Prorocentrum_lima.AAC.1